MELAVATTGLTRDFGSFRAVDGIDLAVPAGSFYGFLGPNGAGKSTTIKCLTGLLPPSAGTMRILGMDPQADPVSVKRRIGVVPEDLALFDRLTAQETLSFVAQVHGIDGGTASGAGGHGSCAFVKVPRQWSPVAGGAPGTSVANGTTDASPDGSIRTSQEPTTSLDQGVAAKSIAL